MTVWCHADDGYAGWAYPTETGIACHGTFISEQPLVLAWMTDGSWAADFTWDCSGDFIETLSTGRVDAVCNGDLETGTILNPAISSSGSSDTSTDTGTDSGSATGNTSSVTLQIEGLEALVTDFDAAVFSIMVLATLTGFSLGWAGRVVLNVINRAKRI